MSLSLRSPTNRGREQLAWQRLARWLLAGVLLNWLLCGCTTHGPAFADRRFKFAEDTFAYPNELVWVYRYDAGGKWVTEKRVPKPEYAQRCFVMASGAQQFFRHARFAPEEKAVPDEDYRRRVRAVLKRSPRSHSKPADRVVIPGFKGLRDFSVAHQQMLKEECGGEWRSYVQRGHWRMVFPLSRGHQARAARELMAALPSESTTVLHVLRFPQLTINHAILVYGFEQRADGLDFLTYDPNDPDEPMRLRYSDASRTFYMSPNTYFPGGRVDVYRVYHHWAY